MISHVIVSGSLASNHSALCIRYIRTRRSEVALPIWMEINACLLFISRLEYKTSIFEPHLV